MGVIFLTMFYLLFCSSIQPFYLCLGNWEVIQCVVLYNFSYVVHLMQELIVCSEN